MSIDDQVNPLSSVRYLLVQTASTGNHRDVDTSIFSFRAMPVLYPPYCDTPRTA